ncbi:hypothetical protein [Aquitalea sp. LB_tupeE]|uniref:hypothetical protein n=1 Tax=Aquitalea sp. LB_tupeE TaxID=2748078 RepID=UPI0015BEF6AE|nr:hypothetical protein [Aquitalea sp. LB_tupeE]NWK79766.1 hypothetical protein [Aquitalea sp. LB_tupeE]
MKKRQEVRQTRLVQLIKEQFNDRQVLLAERIGVAPALISGYITGSKNMGEKMRDKIETACGLHTGWLDLSIDQVDTENKVEAGSKSPQQVPQYQISASNIDDLARQLGRQLKGKAAFEFISKLAEEIRKQS